MCVHAPSTVGISFFGASDFRYLTGSSVVDAPVEKMPVVCEFYVNYHLPERRNQQRDATHHVIAPDVTPQSATTGVFMKGRDMLIFHSFRKAKN